MEWIVLLSYTFEYFLKSLYSHISFASVELAPEKINILVTYEIVYLFDEILELIVF